LERSFYDYQKFKEEKKRCKKGIAKERTIHENQMEMERLKGLNKTIIQDNSSQENLSNLSGDDFDKDDNEESGSNENSSEKDDKEEIGSNESSPKSDASATSANNYNNTTNNNKAVSFNENQPFHFNNLDNKNNKLSDNNKAVTYNENQPFQINNVDNKNNKHESIKSCSNIDYAIKEISDDRESDKEEEEKYKNENAKSFKRDDNPTNQSHLGDVKKQTKKSNTLIDSSDGKKTTIKETKESTKITNNKNPKYITKHFNQKFFNQIKEVIKFLEDHNVIDTKIKTKNPMPVLNKLLTVSDSYQRNKFLNKLETISSNMLKEYKENLDTQQ